MEEPSRGLLARTAVLIPAWEPDESLIQLVSSLLALSFPAVIVVNDGSGAGCDRIFEEIEHDARVRVLRHSFNQGKGRALKTSMRYVLDHLLEFDGVVTCDADGQHRPEDVRATAEHMHREPGKLILGVRRFQGSVPLRSRFRNALTRHVFAFLAGSTLSDTQSGLRGIPRELTSRLLLLDGERYDYEMNVLAYAAASFGIAEVPIQTIYLNQNRCSHFQPFWDSMRIYLVLARFYLSSLVAAAIDLLIFAFVFWMTASVLVSVVSGRVSSIANFVLNRRLVFRSGAAGPRPAEPPRDCGRGRMAGGAYRGLGFSWRSVATTATLVRYYGLVLLIAAASYFGIRLLSRGLGLNVLAAKVLVEIALSLASFSIQRSYVFPSWARQ